MSLIQVGIVGGGGEGSFFGPVHRDSIRLAGMEVTASALSSDPERALEAAKEPEWSVPRAYPSLKALLKAEAPDGIHYLTIATPNNMHVPQAIASLKAGLAVFCEKPAGRNLAETKRLAGVAKQTGAPLGFAYTYRYSPGMNIARLIVQSGIIGAVREVYVTYLQGWLFFLREADPSNPGYRQAKARTDPAISGDSCCGGDIGLSHGVIAARFCTGASFDAVCADMPTLVKGRRLDDTCNVFAKISGPNIAKGARAIFLSTQIGIGEKNNHGIVIYGEKGTVRWFEEDPEKVTVNIDGQAERVVHRGEDLSKDPSLRRIAGKIGEFNVLPPGHPQAFHDWLAYAHKEFASAVTVWRRSGKKRPATGNFATIEDALVSAAVIDASVKNHKGTRKWTPVPKVV